MPVNTEAKAGAGGFVAMARRWAHDGRLYTLLPAAGFSKAVFAKPAYGAHPVAPIALLALRMGFALSIYWVSLDIQRLGAAQPAPISDISTTSAGTARP